MASLDSFIRDEIAGNCRQFLLETSGVPVMKTLPATTARFASVKARHRSHLEPWEQVVESAMAPIATRLLQSGIHAQGRGYDRNGHSYYIFLPDGYKYVYWPAVPGAFATYRDMYSMLGPDIVQEIVKFNATTNNLPYGLLTRNEIWFYGVKRFYAIKTSACTYEHIMEVASEV